MHDPMTVAFDIKSPWKRGGYRPTLVTIWHVDPEKGGSDDSCGFSFPRLTKAQRSRIRDFAWWEGHDPYFLREASKGWTGSRAEAECLYRALVLLTARALNVRMSVDEATRIAISRVHNGGVEDGAKAFCWLPGWHCNGEDSKEKRQDHLAGIMCGIARSLLADRRRWWQHPRWHVWHWRIQVRALLDFKRWAFSRCATCGGRFTYGYSPVTNSWHGAGPRWFRSEPDVHHGNCAAKGHNCAAKAAS